MNLSININGIEVIKERDHYILIKDNKKYSCDLGELNKTIEELTEGGF